MIISTFRLNFYYYYMPRTQRSSRYFPCDPDSQQYVLRVGYFKLSIKNTLVSAYHVPSSVRILSDRKEEKADIIF